MRSDNVTKGAERAPNRSLFYALGYTPEDLEKPLIAVVSAHSDIVPGHMNLDKLTDAVKSGIEAAGGTPFMVPAIGVCDGIAMGHLNGGAARHAHAGLYGLGDLIQVKMPRDDLAVRAYHANQRTVEFFIGIPHRVKQRAVRRPLYALGHICASQLHACVASLIVSKWLIFLASSSYRAALCPPFPADAQLPHGGSPKIWPCARRQIPA